MIPIGSKTDLGRTLDFVFLKVNKVDLTAVPLDNERLAALIGLLRANDLVTTVKIDDTVLEALPEASRSGLAQFMAMNEALAKIWELGSPSVEASTKTLFGCAALGKHSAISRLLKLKENGPAPGTTIEGAHTPDGEARALLAHGIALRTARGRAGATAMYDLFRAHCEIDWFLAVQLAQDPSKAALVGDILARLASEEFAASKVVPRTSVNGKGLGTVLHAVIGAYASGALDSATAVMLTGSVLDADPTQRTVTDSLGKSGFRSCCLPFNVCDPGQVRLLGCFHRRRNAFGSGMPGRGSATRAS